MMYQTLTGKRPFTGSSPMSILFQHVTDPPKPPIEILPSLPPELNELILQCMAKHPDGRPQTVPEIQSVVHGVLVNRLHLRSPEEANAAGNQDLFSDQELDTYAGFTPTAEKLLDSQILRSYESHAHLPAAASGGALAANGIDFARQADLDAATAFSPPGSEPSAHPTPGIEAASSTAVVEEGGYYEAGEAGIGFNRWQAAILAVAAGGIALVAYVGLLWGLGWIPVGNHRPPPSTVPSPTQVTQPIQILDVEDPLQAEVDKMLRQAELTRKEAGDHGNLDALMALYNRVLLLDPKNETASTQVGLLIDGFKQRAMKALSAGDLEMALDISQKARSYAPNDAMAKQIYDTALSQMLQASSATSESLAQAAKLIAMSQPIAARLILEGILTTEPENTEALELDAQAKALVRRQEEEKEHAQKAEEKARADAEAKRVQAAKEWERRKRLAEERKRKAAEAARKKTPKTDGTASTTPTKPPSTTLHHSAETIGEAASPESGKPGIQETPHTRSTPETAASDKTPSSAPLIQTEGTPVRATAPTPTSLPAAAILPPTVTPTGKKTPTPSPKQKPPTPKPATPHLAAVREGDLVKLQQGVTPPILRTGILLRLPEALRRGHAGKILVVDLLVNEKGRVDDAKIIKAPFDSYHDRILKQIRKAKFKPARVGTIKVKCWVPIRIRIH